METSISEGEIIEGSVTACLRRDLIMDEYFMLANFLVTRIGPEAESVSIPFQILFKDEQSDIINPPRNTFVRAEIDERICASQTKTHIHADQYCVRGPRLPPDRFENSVAAEILGLIATTS
jgi:hypothetical protein